jgi:hypothetical protein
MTITAWQMHKLEVRMTLPHLVLILKQFTVIDLKKMCTFCFLENANEHDGCKTSLLSFLIDDQEPMKQWNKEHATWYADRSQACLQTMHITDILFLKKDDANL